MCLTFVIDSDSFARLVAIMLGRLRMTTEECLNAYRELSPRVFAETTSRRFGILSVAAGNTWFKGDTLKTEIIKLLEKREVSRDELMKESDDADCKVYVYHMYMKLALEG